MVETRLSSFNEIEKVVESKQGVIIMYKPLSVFRKVVDIYFCSCRFSKINYRNMFGAEPDKKFDKSKIRFYHYNSFEEIEIEYPDATFRNIQSRYTSKILEIE